MMNRNQTIWLAAGLRTPFVHVDGPFAKRDSLALSVPVAQAMAAQANGPIDFGVWGSVVQNLAYANLAREIWLDAKLDPHVPTFTTVMQCSTSMVGVFEAAGMLGKGTRQLAMVGGVESMTRVQIGLSQNFSVWLRRLFQARSVGRSGSSLLRKLRPSDIRLYRSGSEEPRHRPQHGRAHRGHGEGLEDRPARNRTSSRWRATSARSRRRIAASSTISSFRSTASQRITFRAATPRWKSSRKLRPAFDRTSGQRHADRRQQLAADRRRGRRSGLRPTRAWRGCRPRRRG